MPVDKAVCGSEKHYLCLRECIYQEIHEKIHAAAECSGSFIRLRAYRCIAVNIVVDAAENDDDIGFGCDIVGSAAESEVMARLFEWHTLMCYPRSADAVIMY